MSTTFTAHASELGSKGFIASITTAGVGGFWVPTVFDPEDASGAAVIAAGANTVYVHQFVLPYFSTVSKATIEVTTGQASTNAVIGIYDANKNKLIDSGAISVASVAFVQASFTEYTLKPGVYFYAWSCDGTTAQGRWLNTDLGSSAAAFMNQGTATRVGTAANAMAALVLPATLGTITTVNTQDSLISYWER